MSKFWNLGVFYVGSIPPNPTVAVGSMRMILLYIDPSCSYNTGTAAAPALLQTTTTTRGAISHEATRIREAKIYKFLDENISLLRLPGVNPAAAEGLAAEVLLERVEPKPGQQIVRPYAILGRDWRHNDTLLEVIKRGAVMANEAIKTAAAEAAAEAAAAEASGEAMEEDTG